MTYAQHRCPNCGAPLPPPPSSGAVRCAYCAALLVLDASGWKPAAPLAEPEPLRDPHLWRLWIGGARYAVLGRIARGEGSDVFFARRDARVTELVVVKALRALEDADLLAREGEVLERLLASTAHGASHFARLLPQPVARGVARLGMKGDLGERPVAVFRHRSGFDATFEDVLREYPEGVAPEAAVWMWKRVLELLAWVHRAGFVHGAVLPAHLLVHPRDHGVVLVGWSRAVPWAPPVPLPATTRDARAFYPDDVWDGAPATIATDLAMSARSVIAVLGGDPARAELPSRVPEPLARLLVACANTTSPADADPLRVKDQLDRAAREAFGPSKFVPFVMPRAR
jgi:hypothetical protein